MILLFYGKRIIRRKVDLNAVGEVLTAAPYTVKFA